jgi:hypothetical protein
MITLTVRSHDARNLPLRGGNIGGVGWHVVWALHALLHLALLHHTQKQRCMSQQALPGNQMGIVCCESASPA